MDGLIFMVLSAIGCVMLAGVAKILLVVLMLVFVG